ncbi:hypothetical protein FACS1894153_1050 [Bacteroidia bacterium]|nr:hypothetical protein FACS1894153_1050 [Bacteroidia bacterium]
MESKKRKINGSDTASTQGNQPVLIYWDNVKAGNQGTIEYTFYKNDTTRTPTKHIMNVPIISVDSLEIDIKLNDYPIFMEQDIIVSEVSDFIIKIPSLKYPNTNYTIEHYEWQLSSGLSIDISNTNLFETSNHTATLTVLPCGNEYDTLKIRAKNTRCPTYPDRYSLWKEVVFKRYIPTPTISSNIDTVVYTSNTPVTFTATSNPPAQFYKWTISNSLNQNVVDSITTGNGISVIHNGCDNLFVSVKSVYCDNKTSAAVSKTIYYTKQTMSIIGPDAITTATSCLGIYTLNNVLPNISSGYWTVGEGLSIASSNANSCTVVRSSNITETNTAQLTYHYFGCNTTNKTPPKYIRPRIEPVFYVYKNLTPLDWSSMVARSGYYFGSIAGPTSEITNYAWALQTPNGMDPTTFSSNIGTFAIVNPPSRFDTIGEENIFTPSFPPGGNQSQCNVGSGSVLFAGRSTSNQKTSFSAGQYCLTLTITDGCGLSRGSQSFYISSPTLPYLLSPNPTSGTLNFSSNNTSQNSGISAFSMGYSSSFSNQVSKVVKIYSLNNGALVLEENILSSSQNFSINLNNIPNGMYLVHILENNVITQTSTISVEK